MPKLITVLAMLVVVSAGCGDGAGGGSDFDVAGAEPGDFVVEHRGAKVRIDTTVGLDDPRVAEIEAFREKIGGEPATYYAISVDNTQADEDFWFVELTVVPETQEQVTFEQVWSAISAWRELIDINEDGDLYSTGVELYNDNLSRDQVVPGAKSEFLVSTWGEIGPAERIYFIPELGEQIEAERVE